MPKNRRRGTQGRNKSSTPKVTASHTPGSGGQALPSSSSSSGQKAQASKPQSSPPPTSGQQQSTGQPPSSQPKSGSQPARGRRVSSSPEATTSHTVGSGGWAFPQATSDTMTHHAPTPMPGDTFRNRSNSVRRKKRDYLAKMAQDNPKGVEAEELHIRQKLDQTVGTEQWAGTMRGGDVPTSDLVDAHRNLASQLDEATGRKGAKNEGDDAKSTIVGTSMSSDGNTIGFGRSGSGPEVEKQDSLNVHFAGRLHKTQEAPKGSTDSLGQFTQGETPPTIVGNNGGQGPVCAAVRAQSAAHDGGQTPPITERSKASTKGSVIEESRDKPKKGGWSPSLVNHAVTVTSSRGEVTSYVQSCNLCVSERKKANKPPKPPRIQ